jgi:hypothetical protein
MMGKPMSHDGGMARAMRQVQRQARRAGFDPGPGMSSKAMHNPGRGGQKSTRYWIKGTIKHPGALHRQLGVPMGKRIPAGKLARASKAGGKLGRRARLAMTLKGFHR